MPPGAQSRVATSGFPLGWSRKREKSKSREPIPCPAPGTAEGTSPSSPAARADQPLRVDPRKGRAASGGRVRG